MSRPCYEVEAAIGRPVGALSEAERLVLERHLSECSECRRASELARTITNMVMSAPAELPELARERAIVGAFERDRARLRSSVRPTARGLWLGATVAAAALLMFGLRLTWRGDASEPPAVATAHAAPRALESLATASGPTHEPAPRPRDEALQPTGEARWLEVASSESRTFGRAHVELGAGTRMRFDREREALELDHGRVTLDVSARDGDSFAVITQNFRVEVLGTLFTVTPQRVEVQRGRVQVLALDGTSLVRELGAGESFDYALRALEKSSTQARRTKPVRSQRAVVLESVAELLQRARKALASGETGSARTLIAKAEEQTGSPHERAEAATLSAECALLEHKPAQAITAYLTVADRFAELAAGENALFAAAQLSARERKVPGARALFERYLARYPQGRFADEARVRLSTFAP